jgi:hypothetical protein
MNFNTNRNLYVLSALFLFSILFTSFSSALTNVNSCITPNTPNEVYNITADIIATGTGTGTCLSIQAAASNITILGNGKRIVGNNTIPSYAIFFSNGGNNATVYNVQTEGFEYPIYGITYGNVTVNNLTVKNTTGKLFRSATPNITFNNVTVDGVMFSTYTTTNTMQNLNNLVVKNSYFNSSYVLAFKDSSKVTITNSTRLRAYTPYIQFDTVTDVNISNTYNLDLLYMLNVGNLTFNNNYYGYYNQTLINVQASTYTIGSVEVKNNIFNSSDSAVNQNYLNFFDVKYKVTIVNNTFGSPTAYLQTNNSLSKQVYLQSANNADISNNRFYLKNTHAIYLRGNATLNSSNIDINNNVMYFSDDTLTYAASCGNDDLGGVTYPRMAIYNCTMSNNYVESVYSTVGKHMVMMKYATLSKAFNNTIRNGGYNFVIKDCENVEAYDNSLSNGTMGTLHVKGTSNSRFYRNTWEDNSNILAGAPIFIWWDNLQNTSNVNNTFYDMDLSNVLKCPQVSISTNASTESYFINVTLRNQTCISVGNGSTTGNNKVFWYWYSNIKVKNEHNQYLPNSLISLIGKSSTISSTTDSNGQVTPLILDFTNIDGVTTFNSPYNLTISNSGYRTQTYVNYLNITQVKNYYATFVLDTHVCSTYESIGYRLSLIAGSLLIIALIFGLMYRNGTLQELTIGQLVLLIVGIIVGITLLVASANNIAGSCVL